MISQRTRALALSFILVASSLAGVVAFAGGATAAPGGMVTIPNDQITEDVPTGESIPLSADELRGHVLADNNAESLEVVLTTPERAEALMGSDANVIGGGEMAIVLRDDVHDAGRDVAIDAGMLRDALGYTPEMIHGTHSSGETWTSPAEYTDGYLRFHIEQFSSNTVTFAGEFSASGTFTDGSTISEELSNYDAASDVAVNLTGVLNTESETVSKMVDDGGSMSITAGGTIDPSNDSISLSNPSQKVHNVPHVPDSNSKYYLDIGNPATVDVDVSGMNEITEVKGQFEMNDNNNEHDIEAFVDGQSLGNVTTNPFVDDNPVLAWDNGTVDVSNQDTVTVKFARYDGAESGAIWLDGPISTSDQWLEVHSSQPSDVSVTLNGNPQTLSPTGSTSLDISTGSQSVDISPDAGTVDATVSWTERTETQDPGVELNGNSKSYTGALADGETTSLTFNQSALAEGSNTYNVSMPSLSADAPPMQVDAEISHSAEDDKTIEYTAEKFSERYNVSRTFASLTDSPSVTIPFDDRVVAMRDLQYRVNDGFWTHLAESDYTLDNTTLEAQLPDVAEGDTITVRANGSKIGVTNGEITVTDPTLPGEDMDSRVKVSEPTTDDLDLGVGGVTDRVAYVYNETWTADAGDSTTINADGSQTLTVPGAELGDVMRVSTLPVSAAPESGDVEVTVPKPVQTSEPVFSVAPGSNDGETVAYTHEDAADGESYVLYSQTDDVVRDSGTASSPLTLEDDDSDETLQFLLDDGGSSSTDGDSDDGAVLAPATSDSDDGFPWWLVPGVGGLALVGVLVWRRGADDVGAATASTSASVASWLQSHPYATGVLAVLSGLGLIVTGLISVPEGTGVVLLVSLIPLASWVALRRWGNQSLVVWGGVTAIALVLGLQILGTDIFALIFASQAGVIATIGAIALAYYALKTYQTEASTPDTTVEFDLESSGGDQR